MSSVLTSVLTSVSMVLITDVNDEISFIRIPSDAPANDAKYWAPTHPRLSLLALSQCTHAVCLLRKCTLDSVSAPAKTCF